MSSIFTDFLHKLGERSSPPDPETFDHLWKTLRGVLAGEMKRRSVWSSPPSFLGVFGWNRWAEQGMETHLVPTGDALEELLAECYSFIFIHRLRALQAQLKLRCNVDGLIHLNVRHFLHDTQKRFDPLGFHLFEVLRTAVRGLIANGDLHVVEGDPRVRNETILCFRRGCDPTEAETVDFGKLVPGWSDDLLPALVTARGKELEEVLDRLRARLGELPARGVRAFRFKDLIDPFKTDVRARWAALFEGSQGEPVTATSEEGDLELRDILRVVRPDDSFEQRDGFEKLVACVETRLEGLACDPATRRHLIRLWRFHCAHAAEWREHQPMDAGDPSSEGKQLSRRKLAELLRIPRDRLPGLYCQLGHLLEDCRQSHARAPRELVSRIGGELSNSSREKR